MTSRFIAAVSIAVPILIVSFLMSEQNAPLTSDETLFNSLKDTNSVELEDMSGTAFTLDDIKRQHKGKVIFIEYWASWCAPCRELMPASEEIRKEVKDLPVAYVYLSIDSDHTKWAKASGEEKISSYPQNYRITNSKTSKFIKKYNISFIPQAMVLDKSGRVYSKSLVPGSKTLVTLLSRLSEN